MDEDRVADARMDGIERRLARNVRALLDDGPALRMDRDPERPDSGSFVPTDDQWAVVEQVLGSRLSVLTGGPGVGKSASMRVLVNVLRAARRSVRLVRPPARRRGASAS